MSRLIYINNRLKELDKELNLWTGILDENNKYYKDQIDIIEAEDKSIKLKLIEIAIENKEKRLKEKEKLLIEKEKIFEDSKEKRDSIKFRNFSVRRQRSLGGRKIKNKKKTHKKRRNNKL